MKTSKLYPILLTLLDICEENKKVENIRQESWRSEYPFEDEPKYQSGRLSYAKEFCTIELKACRGAGHTLAIINLIQSRFNKSIVMVPKETQKKTIEHILDSLDVSKEKYHIKSIGSGDCRDVILRGVDYSTFDAIIWDCAFVLSRKDKEKIYKSVLPCCYKNMPYFIFLE